MQTNEEMLSTLVPDDLLAGRTAIVTGSSSGIGAAIARVLAASGAQVVVSGTNAQRVERVVADIADAGGRATPVTADIAGSYANIREFAQRASEALGGKVDILVNNAGIYPVGPTADLSDSELDALLAVNVRAPHVLVAALASAMQGGVVVNIGSWMARVGTPFGAMYTATKAAIEQLTRNWAAEFASRGIRFVTVAPGATATPGNADAADALAQMTKATPAGVPVRPYDIARAVRYAVSGDGAFLSGGIIDVDGGIASTRGA